MTTAMLASVALLRDIPAVPGAVIDGGHGGLSRGSVGTVVHQHDEHNYMVEFVKSVKSDGSGAPYALLDLHEDSFVLVDKFPP
jgi:hypothetical protein